MTSCSTSQAIIQETGIDVQNFVMQDIKTEAITPIQLAFIQKLAGSYEAVFSRRAMKYKEWGLKEKKLKEEDFRNYILQEYTFLKRPVVVIGNNIFVGSEKKNIDALKQAVKELINNE